MYSASLKHAKAISQKADKSFHEKKVIDGGKES
jgi:hypothetical protein